MAITNTGSASTLAILGNDSTLQNLFTITNRPDSRVNVNVRRLLIQLDTVGTLSAFMPLVKTSRATGISGGALLDDCMFNTSQSPSQAVEIRATFGGLFGITASAGNTIWQQYLSRQVSSAEQQIAADGNGLPALVSNSASPFVLRPGESILVQVVAAAYTSNLMQYNNWIMLVSWEEDSLPTFTISGNVTLSSVGVVGAKVIVMEADDINMTNAVLKEVVTTTAGGAWSSSIRTGRVGAAFVQYESSGTLYTAPGSPYLQ